MKVAYMMSRFPKLTETFVLYEILEVEKHGVAVEIRPLLRARNTGSHPEGATLARKVTELLQRPSEDAVMHPEAVALMRQVTFTPLVSLRVVRAQLRMFARSPRRYVAALAMLVRAGWGSANFLLGGLAIFPQTVYVAEQLAASGVGHVHAHFANHPTTAALLVHELTGIPFSFTAHGSDIQVDRRMLREKVSAAAFVVAVSEDNRELLMTTAGPGTAAKIDVIHCGTDTRVFAPRGRSSGACLEIVCVGTLYEVKGQTHLIEACRLLAADGIDFRCRLVGVGPDLEALNRQVQDAELGDRVEFLGARTRGEVADLLAEADVLVAPSVTARDGRREGIPVVLMEAMACGVPVVASAISGIAELVYDGREGLLVAPGDAGGLAAALTRLQAEPALRHDLGVAAREKVLQEFDLEANAAALVARFREVAIR